APEPSNAFLRRIVAEARRTLESPRPYIPEFASSSRLAQLNRERDAEIERRLRPQLPSSLPPEDEQIVRQSLSNRGFLAKAAREQVSAQDLSRLRPSQWLNDEIINFYGALISERAAKFEVESAEKNNTPAVNGHSKEQGKSRSTSDDGNPWKVHIFNTFFMSKLQELGYDKARLNKWTKKIDIFGKDLVLIPCNLGNSHWTCAAINFRQKRIEYYDSMGTDRPSIRQALRTYLEKEHMDKKSSPFDFDGWVDYFGEDGPQQENGYDCGVFVCQTMENLSRGVSLPFDFTQKNMSYLRRRMILEITNEKLPLQRP
ncbi:Smt3-specific protease, partial [Serendipita sp. 396]